MDGVWSNTDAEVSFLEIWATHGHLPETEMGNTRFPGFFMIG
jgi:hypothetical protein